MGNWKDDYLAAKTLADITNNNRIKTLDELPGLLVNEPKALALLDELKSASCPIETVKDLKASIDWLHFLNAEDERMKWEGEETPFYPKKPVFYTEPDTIVVTDSDFIPYPELSSYYDYRIVCGVLCAHDELEQYEDLINSLRRARTTLFKKVCIKAWTSLLEQTLKRLVEIRERYKTSEIRVRVPFFFYDEIIDKTIARYKRTKLIIETLTEENRFDDEEVEKETIDSGKVPFLWLAFQRYAILLDEKHLPGLEYIHEEMIRRGLMSPVSTMNISNGYRIHLLGDKNASSTPNDGSDKLDGELINRVGVLYCMLYGLVDDNSLLTKIAHFALNDKKPFKERTSSNTEYTYIAHPMERLFDTFEKKGFVEDKLTEYGFAADTLSKVMKELRAKKQS